MAGCAPTRQNAVPGEELKNPGTEQRGTAFLFDVKVNRNGKKNSVRLDIYQRGDSLSVFARGYLGKGALKGLLTSDSVIAHFPTEEEYYTGKLESLISDSCQFGQNLERILVTIFRDLPDTSDLPSDISLRTLEDGKKKKRYHMESGRCPAAIDLQYDYHDKQFILEQIGFALSDNSFQLDGKRRDFRTNVKIPEEKFQVNIPETATRIYPH
jgi:hypothetical protein